MINYILGEIDTVGDGYIILENNGIGYYITMPASSIYKLGSGQVKVYTYMAVREDDVSLYGFASKGELECFKLLIGVSGVGPRGAIGILSSISAEELKLAVAAEDAKLIAGAKGIGSKTAQKIVLELKGKIDRDSVLASPVSNTGASAGITGKAIDTLEALGFSRSSAVKAINQLEIPEGCDAGTVVNLALKIIE